MVDSDIFFSFANTHTLLLHHNAHEGAALEVGVEAQGAHGARLERRQNQGGRILPFLF